MTKAVVLAESKEARDYITRIQTLMGNILGFQDTSDELKGAVNRFLYQLKSFTDSGTISPEDCRSLVEGSRAILIETPGGPLTPAESALLQKTVTAAKDLKTYV